MESVFTLYLFSIVQWCHRLSCSTHPDDRFIQKGLQNQISPGLIDGGLRYLFVR